MDDNQVIMLAMMHIIQFLVGWGLVLFLTMITLKKVRLWITKRLLKKTDLNKYELWVSYKGRPTILRNKKDHNDLIYL